MMNARTQKRGPGFRVNASRTILVFSVFALLSRMPIDAAPLDEKLVRESQEAMEKADPFMGDWQGSFTQKNNKRSSPLVAQVVALGKGRYHATLLPEFDKRTTPIASLEGRRDGDTVRFIGWGDVSCYRGPDWDGLIEEGKFTGSVPAREGGTFELHKVVRISPTLGAAPPVGAIVLFDGKNFDQWESFRRAAPSKSPAGKGAARKGGTAKSDPSQPAASKPAPAKSALRIPAPVKWVIVDDAMHPTSGSGSVFTKQKFMHFKLHVEFRTPFMPEKREQDRGNSGVLFHRREVQVLDTYGLGGRDKECGAIYARVAPLVNLCAPPLQWQTYDITVEAPDKNANARLTVLHNGVTVHEGLDLGPLTEPTGIELQNHGNPVAYRNVWLVELP